MSIVCAKQLGGDWIFNGGFLYEKTNNEKFNHMQDMFFEIVSKTIIYVFQKLVDKYFIKNKYQPKHFER